MLEKIQYYINYAKTVINYASKAVNVVASAVNAWPKWGAPASEAPGIIPDSVVQSDRPNQVETN